MLINEKDIYVRIIIIIEIINYKWSTKKVKEKL